jgi:hypothetical protein
MMAADTSGFWSTQATAGWALVSPASLASRVSCRTAANTGSLSHALMISEPPADPWHGMPPVEPGRVGTCRSGRLGRSVTTQSVRCPAPESSDHVALDDSPQHVVLRWLETRGSAASGKTVSLSTLSRAPFPDAEVQRLARSHHVGERLQVTSSGVWSAKRCAW